MQKSGDPLKRYVLMIILGVSWVSYNTAWAGMEWLGKSSPILRVVFGMNALFHPVMFVIALFRLLPLRFVEVSCLLFAAGMCALCMAMRLYSPDYGATIDIQPLYLWIPVIYVFVFTVTGHRSSLTLSLLILALFVLISLPYLYRGFGQPYANFTVQLHGVSAVLIAALYFFSSSQHRLQLAQLSVEELARLANTDELTKLANRRRAVEAIDSELVRYSRYGSGFSIILIDIDNFKSVNDRFGHRAGNLTLVALAVRTKEVLRDVDTLGRWGGEEFLMILPETSYEHALDKATALCAHVAARPLSGDQSVTISCGVTRVPGRRGGLAVSHGRSKTYRAPPMRTTANRPRRWRLKPPGPRARMDSWATSWSVFAPRWLSPSRVSCCLIAKVKKLATARPRPDPCCSACCSVTLAALQSSSS